MRFIILVLWVVGFAGAASAESRTISVAGEGVVAAVPDMAILTLEVSEEAVKASDALESVAGRARAVFARLEAFKIAERDMQTSTMSLNPLWSREREVDQSPKIRGYRVSTRVTIRVRDLDLLRDIFDQVVADGANGFGGLQFTVQDMAPLREAARRAAVADARARAGVYADAAGVSLGSVMSLSETRMPMPRPALMARAEMAADGGMPVAAGEVDIRASVSMVFEIEDAGE